MKQRFPRLRKAGVAALSAITASLGLAVFAANPASAAVNARLAAQTTAPVTPGGTNQPAGNWVLGPLVGPVTLGDTVTITLDDNDASGPDPNCVSAADSIGFAGTPTVTTTRLPGAPDPAPAPTFSVATQSSPGICTVLGVKDQLKITFTNNGGGTAAPRDILVISGVTYNVGSGVAPGTIRVIPTASAGAITFTGTDSTPATPDDNNPSNDGPSNAFVVAAAATANNPPVTLKPGTTNQPISPIVITELLPGALPSGTVISIQPNWNGLGFSETTDINPTTTGTVSASGPGTSTSTIGLDTTPTPNCFQFRLTSQSVGQPGTYTVSGLRVDTQPDASGPVRFNIGTTGCGSIDISGPSGTIVAVAVNGTRLGGLDRIETAAVITQESFGCDDIGPDRFQNGGTVVLARADLFPDAMSANYLAGYLYTGILLTNSNNLPATTLSAIRAMGVRNVYIVGGDAAVSPAVRQQLANTQWYSCNGVAQTTPENKPVNLNVTVFGGADRFETNRLIDTFAVPSNQVGTADYDADNVPNPMRTAVVASGRNFPDALTSGPMQYTGQSDYNGITQANGNGFPLVLVEPGSLNSAAQSTLLGLGIKQVLITGGTDAVSAGVETAIQALGITTKRLAGANRQETAVAIAQFETTMCADVVNPLQPANTCSRPNGLGWTTEHVNIARGDVFADALVGGPHAGVDGGWRSVATLSNGQWDSRRIPENGFGNQLSFESGTPILLTEGAALGTATRNFIKSQSTVVRGFPGIDSFDAFGQTAAVPASAFNEVFTAINGA